MISPTVELFYSNAWNNITSYVYERDGIDIDRGRADENSTINPGRLSLTLNNRDGRFTPQNPNGPLYGLIGLNTRIRVTVNGSVRFVGEVVAWPPRWDVTGSDVYMPLEAAGLLRRLNAGVSEPQPLYSPIRRFYEAFEAANPGIIVAYLPLEDGSGTQFPINVPGGKSARYNDPEPSYGGDGSLAGSMPLPSWPVAQTPVTFGDPFGVLPHQYSWSVHVLARVPAGSGECRIVEWRTDGTRTDWALGVNASDKLVVTAADDTTTDTYTFTAGPDLDDGAWHRLSVHVWQSTATNQQVVLAVDGTTPGSVVSTQRVGKVLRVRPRPTFTVTTNKSAIGLGHCVVLGGNLGVGGRSLAHFSFGLQPPLDGYTGELATARFVRLCDEEGNDCTIHGTTPVVRDTFTRSVVDGWGTPDTGSAWTLTGTAANFDVGGGVGTIVGTSGGQFAHQHTSYQDVELLCKVKTSTLDREVALVARRVSATDYYSFEIDFDAGSHSIDIFRVLGGVVTNIATFVLPSDYLAQDAWFWMQARAIGTSLSLRVWPDSLGEDAAVRVATINGEHASGGVGVAAWSAAGSTKSFDELTVTVIPRSARLGPQRTGTLLQLLQDAADADLGILHESRDELGLTFRPLSTLYNQTPTMALDYAAGEVSPPFHPDPGDDRYVTNDVTAGRTDGGTDRSHFEAGDPKAVSRIGRYPTEVTLNVQSDLQLRDIARWLLHLGVWPEARYPTLRVDLRRLAEVLGDTALRDAALDMEIGDVATVDNPPQWLPPNQISVLAQGYREHIRRASHDIIFNATPAGPYTVGMYGSTAPGPAAAQRRDTAGSELTAQFVAGTGTSMTVATTQGPPWGVTGASNMHFPFDVNVAGARVRVTAITGAASPQTFTVNAAVVNGVTKTIPAGTSVRLWQPAIRAL